MSTVSGAAEASLEDEEEKSVRDEPINIDFAMTGELAKEVRAKKESKLVVPLHEKTASRKPKIVKALIHEKIFDLDEELEMWINKIDLGFRKQKYHMTTREHFPENLVFVAEKHIEFKSLVNEKKQRRRNPEQRTAHDKKIIKFAKSLNLPTPPYPELEVVRKFK